MSNQLPKGWKEDKLGNHSVILRGSTITKSQVTHGEYPVVAGGKEAAYYHNAYNREAPIITVSGSGASAGYVNFWENPIFASDCSTIAEKDVNIKYLYYFLKNKQQEILDKQVGVAIPHVSPKDIIPLILTYPEDKDEQRYIVDTLDTVAEAIRLRKDTIEKTKELIPAIFSDMFGDPIKNEKGFKVSSLGNENICRLQYGYTGTAISDGDIRYIRITDIDKDGYISNANIAYLNYDSSMSDCVLKKKDLVVARTGATYAKTLLYKEESEAVFASFLIKIIFEANAIIPEFYWAYTQTQSYWHQANSLVSGVAQPQFNGGALKQIKILLPPLPLQQEFARKVEEINKYLEAQKAELGYFEELFQSLLQDAFIGKLTWNFPRGEKK